MLLLIDQRLSTETLGELQVEQDKIDILPTYPEQVKKASSLWSNKPDDTFDEVKLALETMCSGVQRCVYCEDSHGNQIEHMKPKQLYPNHAFVWDNYVFSCGVCNNTKRAYFAVFDANDKVIDVTRKPKAPKVPPQDGASVFLNPRIEDGIEYLILDLKDGFMFVPMFGISERDKQRAIYTRDLIDLNRDMLINARRNAYEGYLAYLELYILKHNNQAGADELQRVINLIKNNHHPTVWQEMKRQRGGIPEIEDLFQQAPEALDW
jgi:uncharacterized protein (TIGR02646 family)